MAQSTFYNNIGNVYFCLSNYDKALGYHNMALEIKKKIFEEDNISMAYSYYNIGNVYYHQDKYTIALEYFQKAYAIWREKLGEDHPNTIITKEQISKCEQKLQESQKK